MSERKLLPLHTPLDMFSRTVTSAEPDSGLINIFEAMHDAGKTRSHNYLLDGKFKERTLCYSTTYIEQDMPALASVAWLRPMYNGVVRLCTRYCVHPTLSNVNFGKGTFGLRLDTVDHILQQMEFCSNLGYTDFFIGREDKTRNGRRSKQIAEEISKHTGIEWKCSDTPVLVAPNPSASDCWQYVIYNNRKDFKNEDNTI